MMPKFVNPRLDCDMTVVVDNVAGVLVGVSVNGGLKSMAVNDGIKC